MLLLNATTKSLEIVLAGAITTSQLPYTAHYVDITTATAAVSSMAESDGTSNSTTAVTVVAAPGASTTRQVKYLSVYNADTVAATVTIQINNNGTARKIAKITLQPGETLELD